MDLAQSIGLPVDGNAHTSQMRTPLHLHHLSHMNPTSAHVEHAGWIGFAADGNATTPFQRARTAWN